MSEGKISESIFTGRSAVIPMADVSHIEKRYYTVDLIEPIRKKGDLMGLVVVTKHTTWDIESDGYNNSVWLTGGDVEAFMKAWCYYRHELEIDTLLPNP